MAATEAWSVSNKEMAVWIRVCPCFRACKGTALRGCGYGKYIERERERSWSTQATKSTAHTNQVAVTTAADTQLSRSMSSWSVLVSPINFADVPKPTHAIEWVHSAGMSPDNTLPVIWPVKLSHWYTVSPKDT